MSVISDLTFIFLTFNSKPALICYFACNFAFFLVKLVHTLVKFCVAKQKVRLLTILVSFGFLLVTLPSCDHFMIQRTFYGSSAHSQDQVLLMITRILSRYVITDITLFDSLFCP